MPSDAPTTSFSSSGEDVISQTIEVAPDTSADVLSPEDFDKFYDIERTAEEIIQGNYKRVCISIR